MRKLIIFENIAIDGYFTGANGEFNWAHDGADDPEFAAFVAQNANSESHLLFGRKTYELMASYWPTDAAKSQNPKVAHGMNMQTKIVFSNTLNNASWENTTIVKGNMVEEVRSLKKKDGPALVVLGSGSIVAQLAAANLIDEYQFIVNPIVLGKGRTPFDNLPHPLALKTKTSRHFKNGKSYFCFEPK